MNALVTGGLGFIGSHLCERLLNDGHRVTVIDDLSTGREENLAAVRGHPRLTCRIGTIRDKALLEEVLSGRDIVFHLAAVVGVKRVLQDPLYCLETNIRGTDMLLELAQERGIKVMLASSSEVYGKNGNKPMQEQDDQVLGPTAVTRWIYATTKAVDEYLALGYWQKDALPVVVMRLFNIVGPRQSDQYGMVLPTFVRQALEARPITVYGDGQQIRCFTYITDALEAMLALAAHPGAPGGVFNVGSEEAVNILDLAQRVKEITGSVSPIEHIPYEEAYGDGFEDTRTRIPDLAKVRALVGYRARVSLNDMIRNIAAYFREAAEAKTAVPGAFHAEGRFAEANLPPRVRPQEEACLGR